jgi:hypothetical protein
MHHHIRQKPSPSSHNARWLALVRLVTVMMPSWLGILLNGNEAIKWKNKTKTRLKRREKENMQKYIQAEG